MQPKTNTCINPSDALPLFENTRNTKPASDELDLFSYKRERLLKTATASSGERGTAGLPLQLGMSMQFPLWAGFFESLGFKVTLPRRNLSPSAIDNDLINSFCPPARVMYRQIEVLLNSGVNFVFLPCESFEIDERCSSGYFNCPLIAYYPELLRVCNDRLTYENFLTPYLDLNLYKKAVSALYSMFRRFGVKRREIPCALKEGFARMESYRADVKAKADEILYKAGKQGRNAVIVAGRPYYIYEDVNHGINTHLLSRGFAVLSEDSVSDYTPSDAFNQWTYHARLYRAAEFAANREDVFLVHLTSSGCRYDEIITEQIKTLLEKNGKPYIRINSDETAARVL